MSHIDWGQKEFQIADKVLSDIINYSYELDAGPVVFTTLEKIYSSWIN